MKLGSFREFYFLKLLTPISHKCYNTKIDKTETQKMKALKTNNLTKLYNYLQLGGKYTTAELSEKFLLSPRTIQGYLKTLRKDYGLIKEKKLYFFSDEYRHIDIDERVQMSTALMISLCKIR